MSKEKLPTHVRCPYCKHEERLPGYVYAHWTSTFTVTCASDKCGKEFSMFQGEAEPIDGL